MTYEEIKAAAVAAIPTKMVLSTFQWFYLTFTLVKAVEFTLDTDGSIGIRGAFNMQPWSKFKDYSLDVTLTDADFTEDGLAIFKAAITSEFEKLASGERINYDYRSKKNNITAEGLLSASFLAAHTELAGLKFRF